MNNDFWLENPSILLEKNKIFEFWPKEHYNMAEKLNAITRSIIVLTTLGYLSTKSFNILVSGIVTLVVIVALYKTKANEAKFKEGLRSMNSLKEDIEKTNAFKESSDKEASRNLSKMAALLTKPSSDNPYMNYMMTDYIDKPNKKPALPLFNNKVKRQTDKAAIKNLDSRLFRNLGDAMDYDTFSRNFHTMPNTTNPNDQRAFAEFCYGNMRSCKEGDCFVTSSSCNENNYLCLESYKDKKKKKKKSKKGKKAKTDGIDVSELDTETLVAFQNLNIDDPQYEEKVKTLLSGEISREQKVKMGLIQADSVFELNN